MPDFLRDIRTSLAERPVVWTIGAILGLAVLSGLVGYWVVVPRVADDIVRDRLVALEERANLETSYRRVEASAMEGVELYDFRVSTPERESPLVEVDHVRASLNLYHLAFGDPVVSSLEVRGAQLTVRRHADGSTNLEKLRRWLGRGDDEGDAGSESDNGAPSFLRYFGGVWPDARIRDAAIAFEATAGAHPWPVRRLSTEAFELHSSGSTARVRTSVDVERGAGGDDRWQFPRHLQVDGTLRLPLERSTGTVDFDRPAELVGIGPAPYLRAGVGRVDVGEDHTVDLHQLSLAVQGNGAPERFGTVDRVRISLARWPTTTDQVELRELVVEAPTITAEIDRQHASAVG